MDGLDEEYQVVIHHPDLSAATKARICDEFTARGYPVPEFYSTHFVHRDTINVVSKRFFFGEPPTVLSSRRAVADLANYTFRPQPFPVGRGNPTGQRGNGHTQNGSGSSSAVSGSMAGLASH